MVWGFIAFVVGVLYGWLSPGREAKAGLFLSGLFWGLIIALILTLIGLWAGASPLGFGPGGFAGFFLGLVIILLIFVLGVWIGDLIESATQRRRTA